MIDILFQDDHIVVMNKVAGQIIIPGRDPNEGMPLVRELEAHLGGTALVVHRLDRETSGVILFARTPEAHRHLNMQFERREVEKCYLALAQGRIEGDGVIDQPIREFGSGRMGVSPKGKPSETRYRVRERLEACTLLEVRPATGRRHQIRVHLYAIGHPVMGDTVYGTERPVGGASRLMLHAWTLFFLHPAGERMTFQAEPGDDWNAEYNRLAGR